MGGFGRVQGSERGSRDKSCWDRGKLPGTLLTSYHFCRLGKLHKPQLLFLLFFVCEEQHALPVERILTFNHCLPVLREYIDTLIY